MTILRENFETALYRVIAEANLTGEKSAFIDGLKMILEGSTRELPIRVAARSPNTPTPPPFLANQ